MSHHDGNKKETNAPQQEEEPEEQESLLTWLDQVCLSFGDQDAIVLQQPQQLDRDNDTSSISICYLELQMYAQVLAAQLYYRYRPDYVLIDGFGHVVGETVAVWASLLLGIPSVPVDHTSPQRLSAIVQALHSSLSPTNSQCQLAVVCCATNDEDMRLGVFYAAGLSNILYVDPHQGYLHERLQVPDELPIELASNASVSNKDNLYILFTSGTTGPAPRAVVGSHRSTVRRLTWWTETFEPCARVARKTRLTFVDGITELLTAVVSPGSVLVAPYEPPVVLDVPELVRLLQPQQVTLLPSQLAVLLPHLTKRSALERILVSGEVFSAALWEQCQKMLLPHVQIIHLYGQTESTGDVLATVLNDLDPINVVVDGVVTVGKPIHKSISISHANNNNDETTLQELVVRGNLSNGYLQQQSRNANTSFEQFATGDVGFCRNGLWYIRGRCTEVQKINGILTSPWEIEAAFASFYKKSTSTVACVIINGASYIVSESPLSEFSRQALHEQGQRPWNLIPQSVFLVDKIPTKSDGAGKVNRQEIRRIVETELAGKQSSAAKDIARTECVLVALVRNVLQLSEESHIDMSKSFVDLGGNSATAVQLLYAMLQNNKTNTNQQLTALDILQSNSLTELESLTKENQVPSR